ncbi:ABC transporter ATP-binding protein [Aquihabitans sp. G128]|uniref:ABC transporter ATP-binding protein n=1 Tax=Aquihabitans sp. G128 TaxID=2849779 RepID=UPI001C224C61|nr:ABC transporter ATP-binding protein [Aquihabitans sp. G128]QXC62908.1 ABC transporter ATP-binding protein [Aquihabitans sp. G128]
MLETLPPDGIRLHDLTKAFGPVQAVRGIDLAVAPGEIVALLGPNGAGKSTTVDLLLGLAQPDAGEAAIFGRSPRQAIDEGIVGAMLQSGGLLRELSVRELIAMVGSLFPHALPVQEVLDLCGIGELADRRTHKLSGGESQRVRFALAIVSDPDLLVLDEPTVAMDVGARNAFWTAMRAFAARGKTVLFATHYLEEADAWADRIVLMARGRIVADGATTEIKAKVGRRTVRFTLADADLDRLGALPGVAQAEHHGGSVLLTCSDADAALRALVAAEPTAADFEVRGAGLEAAFLELTADEPEVDQPAPTLDAPEVVR